LGAAPTFLFVGRNYHLKGLSVALRALARLDRDGRAASLSVLGGAPVAPFAALAERLGVGPRVRFWPGVADPRPHFAAADVLLHPTFYDSCSLVVLEAWAMGVPAITSRWNGVHALWPAAHRDWLVEDPADVEAVARAMRAALDPARRASAGAVGRGVALAHPIEANYSRIVDLYEDVVTRGRGAPR
jgi:UDP-glucose:(heptosyl)LPS alpha-1,3-glucosyltransferase